MTGPTDHGRVTVRRMRRNRVTFDQPYGPVERWSRIRRRVRRTQGVRFASPHYCPPTKAGGAS